MKVKIPSRFWQSQALLSLSPGCLELTNSTEDKITILMTPHSLWLHPGNYTPGLHDLRCQLNSKGRNWKPIRTTVSFLHMLLFILFSLFNIFSPCADFFLGPTYYFSIKVSLSNELLTGSDVSAFECWRDGRETESIGVDRDDSGRNEFIVLPFAVWN